MNEKKLVVLQVLPELNQGGVELGTIEIASELQKKGIENFVASEGGRMEPALERLKVKHFTLPLKTKNIFKMYLNSLRLAKIIKKYSIVWTTEEHSIIGGLGDIVCECVARFNLGTLVRNVGIRDEIKSTVGTRDYLISNADGAYNIGAAALIDDIKKCKMAIKM